MRFLLVILLFALCACDGGTRAPDKARTSTIIRISDSDARGLDPQIVSDLASIRIAADQFEGLTTFSADGEVIAGLAESWSIRNGGKLWIFKLRPGLTFSDGEPILADNFVQGLARIRDEKTASPHAALFSIIDHIAAPDRQTVEIRLHSPFPQLPALLAHPAMAALPFHHVGVKGERWTSMRPLVTSGPYRLTDWQLAQQLTLQANPRWHGGRPAIAEIIWRPMENPQSAMRLMLAGGADVSSDFPSSRLAWLKSNHPRLVRVKDFLGSYYFIFNIRRPPFNDANVRRALSMAVDRKWLAEVMVASGNAPAWGVLPPGLTGDQGYRPEWADWPRSKRLSEARRMLASAGYDARRPLIFDIRFNSSSEHRRAAAAMATMWREIGVDAKLLNSESSLHFDALRRGDFDLARSGWIADLPAPENFLAIHRRDAGTQNYSGYANPAFDLALDSALAEGDPERRLSAMKAAERILIEDMPVIPLYYYVSRSLVQPEIRGWSDNISNVHPSRFLHRVKP